MANQEILNRKDALTGFHTKEGLNEYLNSKLTTVYSRPNNLSVIMLDLDNFKGINDKHGHLIGDDALRFFAMIINTALRGQHFVARYGGDEFVIVMPDSQNCKDSLEIAKRVRANLQKEKFITPTGGIRVNTSIGIGNYPRDGQTGRSLIEAADQVLYYAKKHGKNRIIHSTTLKGISRRDEVFLGLKVIAVATFVIVSVSSFMTTGSLRGVVDYLNGVGYYGRYELNRRFERKNFAEVELKDGKTLKGWIIEDKKHVLLLSLVEPVFTVNSVSKMTSLRPIKLPRADIRSTIKSLKN